MAYAIGIVVGLLSALLGRVARLDRERAFYPTILIVVAAYYILFAAMGASRGVLVAESLGAVVFTAVAIIGFNGNLWLVAAGLAGHGVFDMFHARLVTDPGVPVWWPAFCMAADVVLGICLAVLLRSGRLPARVPGAFLTPAGGASSPSI